MKQYKLIREYPGSPKLGTILTHEELQYCNWDEYYQEVVEKDYKILSLARLCTIKPTITDVSDYGDGYIEALLKCDKSRIHSIKRNDGEVFTVGDKTEFGDIIKYFKIDNKSNLLIIGYKDCEDVLEFVGHSKQKLFTTEDDVDIFKGDSYVALLSNYDLTQEKAGFNHDNIYCHCLKFSTKEKAEEYILYNKPLLTLKDIEELLCKNTSSYFLEKFKKRAQKLNNKN